MMMIILVIISTTRKLLMSIKSPQEMFLLELSDAKLWQRNTLIKFVMCIKPHRQINRTSIILC